MDFCYCWALLHLLMACLFTVFWKLINNFSKHHIFRRIVTMCQYQHIHSHRVSETCIWVCECLSVTKIARTSGCWWMICTTTDTVLCGHGHFWFIINSSRSNQPCLRLSRPNDTSILYSFCILVRHCDGGVCVCVKASPEACGCSSYLQVFFFFFSNEFVCVFHALLFNFCDTLCHRYIDTYMDDRIESE